MKKKVGKLLAAHALQGRSPLYRWLHEHHAEIAAEMATQARPPWEALAQTARDNGQLAANGNPPNRHSIRKAWQTLERDLNRQPTVQTPVPPNVPPVSSSPAVTVQPAISAPKPRHVFAVARFKRSPEKEG